MANHDRKFLRSYLPSHIRNPFKLVIRLLTSGSIEARFALISALIGIIVAPLDLVLSIFEKRSYARHDRPQRPLVFVCGPPRSGTTLLSQVLINNLPVEYFNNLTSWFPRSPLMAMHLFGRWLPKHEVGYKAYYGKTRYLSGPNDALYLWDRWVGKNRDTVPSQLLPGAEKDMPQFFAAAEDLLDSAIINKNNRLNTYAHLAANALPTAIFICLRRNPLMLAQSLLIARKEIVGQVDLPYGIDSKDRPRPNAEDYLDDICQQVLYYERAAEQQQQQIGKDRFWIIDYEEFCHEPQKLVQKVAKSVLKLSEAPPALADLKPFTVSNKVRISEEEFAGLRQRLVQLLPERFSDRSV
jgi:hypothetical protein